MGQVADLFDEIGSHITAKIYRDVVMEDLLGQQVEAKEQIAEQAQRLEAAEKKLEALTRAHKKLEFQASFGPMSGLQAACFFLLRFSTFTWYL